MSDQAYYPPVGFYFQLTFAGTSGSIEAAFKEVSGLTMEMGIEEVSEGGENNSKLRIPTSVKFENLVLKRGLVVKSSELVKWCSDTFEGQLNKPIETKSITVHLLDEKAKPLSSWVFHSAWPVKWEVSDLKSMDGKLAIETLEFSYTFFERTV